MRAKDYNTLTKHSVVHLIQINKQASRPTKMFFLTAEIQLMNIEGIIKLEKSVFGKNYQSMQKSECESLKK